MYAMQRIGHKAGLLLMAVLVRLKGIQEHVKYKSGFMVLWQLFHLNVGLRHRSGSLFDSKVTTLAQKNNKKAPGRFSS